MNVSFEERLLATIPEDLAEFIQDSDSRIFFSPEGRRVAYVVQLTGEMDENPRAFVVVNDQREPEVGRVGEVEGCFLSGNVQFTKDGRRHAYVFRMGNYKSGREGVMVDGRKGPLFDRVSEPHFSPDGKRIAYEAKENGRSFVVIDHEPLGREFDKADCPVFHPDGKRVAYRGYKLGDADEDGDRPTLSMFIVMDGVKREEFDFVGAPVIRSDGHTVAYLAEKNGQYKIVGAPDRTEGYDYLGPPIFSPDGRHVACEAGKGGRFFILVDGKELPSEFKSIADPIFSPDGRRVAFRGIRDADPAYGTDGPPSATSDGRQCMVVDGEAGEDCQFIYKPCFGPDNRRLLYTMKQGRDWFIVYGREKRGGAEFSDVHEPAVSPDGSRFAFVADHAGDDDWFVVCGGQRSQSFDYVRSPVFSPDGKRIGFGARKGRELWWKVMELK